MFLGGEGLDGPMPGPQAWLMQRKVRLQAWLRSL